MDVGDVVLWAWAGAWGGYHVWRLHRGSWRRYLRRTRRYSIRDFPDGQPGRVVGTVEPIERELTSALYEQPCVYYSCVAMRDRTNGITLSRGPHWQTLAIEASSEPFAIVDDSGRAIVEPRGGQLVGFEAIRRHSTLATPSDRQRDFMKRHNILGGPAVTVIETIIRTGDRIAVLGAGRRETDPDAAPEGYRNDRPTRLHIAYSKSYRLAFSDLPATMK